MKPIATILLCSAAALALSGCSISRQVAKVSGRVEEMYALAKPWEQLPLRTITWQQALDLMRRNNVELQKAEDTIEDAERESLSIYTDMIPGVSYYGFLTSSIDQLSDTVTGKSELSSNINVSFTLPALTQVPYKVYSSKVTTFAAIKAREGKERELTAQLYQTVRLRQLNRKKEALETEPADEAEAIRQTQERRDTNTKHWQAMAQIIGIPDARWEILPQSLPRIRWADYVGRLDKLDPLIVCNFAMQLEQARMAQYGIALQYLPTINTSLYSPSLFTSTGGTYSGTFLSGEDTKLNLSISYTLDTDLRIWNNYQRSKERYELTRRTVAAELREHKIKVDLLRRSVAEYESWRRFMQKRLTFTEQMTAGNAAQYIEREQAIRSIKEEMIAQEIAALESEAALILQYGLPGSKEAAATR